MAFFTQKKLTSDKTKQNILCFIMFILLRAISLCQLNVFFLGRFTHHQWGSLSLKSISSAERVLDCGLCNLIVQHSCHTVAPCSGSVDMGSLSLAPHFLQCKGQSVPLRQVTCGQVRASSAHKTHLPYP